MNFMSTMHKLFFEYFIGSASSGPFQTLADDILPTCDFFFLPERQVSLASQTLFVSAAVLIAYWIWVLESIGTAEQKESGLWD